MPGAVLLCCSLDAEVYLAPALVELGRAGQVVDVVSGIEEDFVPVGRALDALEESGIVILVRDPSLSTEVVRRIEGVFSARHKPGQTFVPIDLDTGESPQQFARRLIEVLRDPQAATRRRAGQAPSPPPESFEPAPEGPVGRGPSPPSSMAEAGRRSSGASSAAAAELEAALATMEAALAGAAGESMSPGGGPSRKATERASGVSADGATAAVAPSRPAAPSSAPAGTSPEAALEPAARTAVGSLVLVAVLGLGLVGAGVFLVRRGPSEPAPAADAKAEAAGGETKAAARRPPAEPAPPAGGARASGSSSAPPIERSPAGRRSSAGPSGMPPAAGAGATAPPETSRDAEADLDYATREALVVARAVAKGRLRAIDDLVVGVVDPSPRPYGEAREACANALVAGVGNFDLATAAQLRLVRRARMIPPGSYWSRTPGQTPGSRQVLRTSEVALADVPESDVAGIVCVRAFPRPD